MRAMRTLLLAAVVVVSDRSAAGEREDRSGPVAVEKLFSAGFAVSEVAVVPDGELSVERALSSDLKPTRPPRKAAIRRLKSPSPPVLATWPPNRPGKAWTRQRSRASARKSRKVATALTPRRSQPG